MALYTVLLLSISWSSVLHEGLGFPVIGQSEVNEPEPAHRVRTKRCSCNNQMDSECHYFCHLDIIWVNTPSKITVYGLGSPLARRRRSAGRCLCANSADQTCSSFCVHSLEEVRRLMLKNLSELLKDQSESPTADLHSALKKQHNVAPVVVVDGTVDRACIDVLTFVRRARTMKRIPAPRQRGSRVFRLAIAKFRLGTMRTAST